MPSHLTLCSYQPLRILILSETSMDSTAGPRLHSVILTWQLRFSRCIHPRHCSGIGILADSEGFGASRKSLRAEIQYFQFFLPLLMDPKSHKAEQEQCSLLITDHYFRWTQQMYACQLSVKNHFVRFKNL